MALIHPTLISTRVPGVGWISAIRRVIQRFLFKKAAAIPQRVDTQLVQADDAQSIGLFDNSVD